ncbi:FGGY family carbohydrate kinase [Microbacterium sp. QXD-8]|uniref:FGGY family carbohydrate kinase n=1 Tax=Microbacterium psychrotolerans TaxID=3068321 RepID=A0ABU0YX96_9MICO|nr:FGGY family carbohydrate kinase [Microbacterium sp. QXD-8]MDQ7876393.1 FGGY family carbohydrate kinase [Microbacterium sp. QXD-8]
MTLVLGLDIGSTSTKAVLVDVADDVIVLHVARASTPTDAVELVATTAALLRACVSAANRPIAALGIASMAESGAALGADGTPLTPLLRWDRPVDPRHLDDLLARHPDLPSRTGLPATTKPAAVALAALRRENTEVFTAVRHWAGVADLVAHALTDVRATDHTLAARTMLAGGRGDAWDAAVLDTVGIDVRILPELRAPGEPVAVTSDAAEAFGLGRGIPVYIAGHDHAVGAWAAGVRTPGAVADSLGTAEAVVRVTDDLNATAGAGRDASASRRRETSGITARAVADGFAIGRTVDGSALTILGGSRACGAMLEWWDGAHDGDGVRARLASLPADPWPATSMTVLPYPSGRQCPVPHPGARVAVRGAAADPTTRARAVLEGLVFQARWMRETIDALAGSPARDVTVLGSLADRIPAWAPLTAAAGTPAFRAATTEPVAAGAALLAAVRAGAASDTVSLAREAVAPAQAPHLDHAYRRFLHAATEGDS